MLKDTLMPDGFRIREHPNGKIEKSRYNEIRD